ncbi:MAG: hypothetical protein GQ531_07095 [Sulfurovum sp.]|nr:hypothetical protein [Sulfurovum sp.]
MKQLLYLFIVVGITINLHAIEFDKPVYEKSPSLLDRAKSLFSFEKPIEYKHIKIEKEDWNNSSVKIINNEISIVSKKYRIEARKILLLQDKSYFVFAEMTKDNGASRGTLVAKFSKNNKLKWVKHYKANDVMISTRFFLDNHGILISGGYSTGKALGSAFIFRIDFNGNIKWTNDYHEKLMVKSYNSIIKINDGYMAVGYITRGYTKVEYKDNTLHMKGTDQLTYSPLITKLNAQGKKVWDKVIETKERSYAVEIETVNTNYLVRTIPTTKAQEIMIDKNGKIISKKLIKELPAYLVNQYGLAPASVSYKSIAVKRIGKKDFQISKIDSHGNDLWKYSINITDNYGDKIKIIETSDGGCLIENFQYRFLKGSAYLIKLDNTGKEEWKRNYLGKKGRFMFNDHIKTGKDKYLFLATSTSDLYASLKENSKKTTFNVTLQSGVMLFELNLHSNKYVEVQ